MKPSNQRIKKFFLALSGMAMALASGSLPVADAQTITHSPLYTVHGDAAFDQFGSAVSGIGDVNGDGFDDWVVGAPNAKDASSNPTFAIGSVRVFSGIDGSTLYTRYSDPIPSSTGAHYSGFGGSVSPTGDGNSDGVADFLVTDAGSFRWFSGSNGATIDRHFLDVASGKSVSGLGDLDGDGKTDFAIGSYNSGSNGEVNVLSGDGTHTPVFTLSGDVSGQQFGRSINDAGDINADGVSDFIVGALGDDSNGANSGIARVYSGSSGTELLTLSGGSAGDGLGISVGRGGDVNGDGIPDLIVGAWGDDVNGSNSGSAFVFSGADGSTLHTFSGDDTDDAMFRVASLPDADGDGVTDFLVSAAGDDNNGDQSGSVRLFSGSDGSTIATFNGDNAGDLFGSAVADAGDVNGDGITDFVVGALSGGVNGGGYARVFVSAITGVPEPSSLLFISLSSLAMLLRRRRHATHWDDNHA